MSSIQFNYFADMNGKQKLKNGVINAIKSLNTKDLNLDNVIDYIDYIEKVRYSEKEIIDILLSIIKESRMH